MFINGVEVLSELEITSFGLGFVTCMICDVFFSISNFFIQRALKIREQRKLMKLRVLRSEDFVKED